MVDCLDSRPNTESTIHSTLVNILWGPRWVGTVWSHQVSIVVWWIEDQGTPPNISHLRQPLLRFQMGHYGWWSPVKQCWNCIHHPFGSHASPVYVDVNVLALSTARILKGDVASISKAKLDQATKYWLWSTWCEFCFDKLRTVFNPKSVNLTTSLESMTQFADLSPPWYDKDDSCMNNMPSTISLIKE